MKLFLLYCTDVHTQTLFLLNVRMHEIGGQATSKPLHYQYKTTPSYTLVSGHPAGMEN